MLVAPAKIKMSRGFCPNGAASTRRKPRVINPVLYMQTGAYTPYRKRHVAAPSALLQTAAGIDANSQSVPLAGT